MGEPAAEVHIDETLVTALLSEQHPDLAHLPLRPLAGGWDNAIFRLGPELLVRLPRRTLSVPLVLHEQRWLPEIAPHLTLPIPVPVRGGVPGCGYPWPWTITPFFPGATADRARPEELESLATQLGTFVTSLHRPAADDAPTNPYRGVPLAEREERTRRGILALDDSVDRQAVLRAWIDIVETPEWAQPPVWVHGDLHPFNLVMRAGKLSAVIDFGDLCAGDPATDLAVGWMLFDGPVRSLFEQAAAVDSNTWRRARGWAIALGVTWVGGGDRLAMIGRRALSSALA